MDVDSIVHKSFNKMSFGDVIKREMTSDQHSSDLATQQLTEELHKPIFRKSEK